MLIETCREFNHDLRICYVDYLKAFDCANHQQLWRPSTDTGFDPKITSLIRNLYNEQQSPVRLECGTTDWLRGVRKGCILPPPHGFTLYTENSIRVVEGDIRRNSFNGIQINGHGKYELRYADSTALSSDTK